MTAPPTLSFVPGTLVTARGRDWLVLPGGDSSTLPVRAVGGTDLDETLLLPALEEISPASFTAPMLADRGDAASATLLRDALRLSFRHNAGPFRSFGSLAVAPRNYQLVPLLMAQQQSTVRLLIADGVGIGKTIEAGLIAAELLACGDAERLVVLCSPQLAVQWQQELRTKFSLPAELLLPSTANRLKRGVLGDRSLFEHYPYLVVSTDYVKQPSRRDEFALYCGDLVIIDEAHSTVGTTSHTGTSIDRYRLVRQLADDPNRHLLLLTATPHSGDHGQWSNLIGLLNDEFQDYPEDLAGERNQAKRERLARHFIQRDRSTISQFLTEETPFPERISGEASYKASRDYETLVNDVIDFARDRVLDTSVNAQRQRVRWWQMLGLLRALASSPAAAAATFGKASGLAPLVQQPTALEDIDAAASPLVYDASDDDPDLPEASDEVLGSDTENLSDDPDGYKAAMGRFAERARALHGPATDVKLKTITKIVTELVGQGYNPILFCRFIPTAQYVADHLSTVSALKKQGVRVEAVTGLLTPDERDLRVQDLTAHDGPRVLVATDCLSEGINLQAGFDAVIHYDLAWNPTRHEQREGRVDRYGQTSKQVKTLTYFGSNSAVDGVVLDVLLRRHDKIKKATGVSVSVPGDTQTALNAAYSRLILKQDGGPVMESLFSLDTEEFELLWRSAADSEKKSRSLFSQGRLSDQAVSDCLTAVRDALGGPADALTFTRDALTRLNVPMTPVAQADGGGFTARVLDVPRAVQDHWPVTANRKPVLRFRETGAPLPGEALLTRVDPYVEALSRYLLDAALDPYLPARTRPAQRAAVIATNAVTTRTVLHVLRFRINLSIPGSKKNRTEVADHADFLAVSYALDGTPTILDRAATEALLHAKASGNVQGDLADDQMQAALDELTGLTPLFNQRGKDAADRLSAEHALVREASRSRAKTLTATHLEPADVLGVYVYLPTGRP